MKRFSGSLGSLCVCVGAVVLATACGGGAPPPVAPVAASKPVAVAPKEPPPDISPVGDPEGLLVIGRVARPTAIMKTVGTWTRLPLPGASELVRSIADDAVADVVDLSQPVDGAVALGGTKRDPKGVWAFSVAVKSFDAAKAKLSAIHKTSPGPNGSLWIAGIGKPEAERTRQDGVTEHDADEDDADGEGCSLAHAVSGARLVCGEREGVDRLTPYLTRSLPRQQWPSDVHVELRLAPAREPVAQLHAMLPILGRGLLGGASPALRDVLDAAAGELVDFVGDADKLSLDAQLTDGGAEATLRVDYQRASSFLAKVATGHPERAEAPPAALFHMPADTDLAFYSRGADAKHFDRPRELVGNMVSELAGQEGMPEAERKTLRDLVADRMMPLFTGPIVYGKGFDRAAVERAIDARKSVKLEDLAAKDTADRTLGSQVIGWHLLSVSEPIAKVGPLLKDWAELWRRPAFTKWARGKTSQKMLAQVKTAPLPAGVKLPKDAVHLEITIPREDLEIAPSGPLATPPPPPPGAKGGRTTTLGGPVAIAKAPAVKKMPRKPIVLHVIAVPDQGSTWLAFGLDAKLLADKAAIALSSAPDTDTFGKTPGAEALQRVKANAAWMVTLRGILVVTAMDRRGVFGMLPTLGNKGTTPILMTVAAQPPSQSAAAGSSMSTFKLPRAAIEDIVKLALNAH